MKSLECVQKACETHKIKSLMSLMTGDKNQFLVNTAVGLALEWVAKDGDGEFDVDKYAKECLDEEQAKAESAVVPQETPCVDTDADGECDAHEHNKALNAGGREE